MRSGRAFGPILVTSPAESASPIVTFAIEDTAAIAEKLADARVNVHVAPTWVPVSPSF